MKQLFLASFLILSAPALAQTTARLTPYIRAGIGVSRAAGAHVSADAFIYLPGPPNDNGGNVVVLGGSRGLLTGAIGLGLSVPVSERVSVQVEANLE